MMTLLLLLLPLVAALAVLLSGNKMASRVALLFTVAEFGLTVYAYTIFKQQGPEAFVFFHDWISSPKISINLGVDGLSFVVIATASGIAFSGPMSANG